MSPRSLSSPYDCSPGVYATHGADNTRGYHGAHGPLGEPARARNFRQRRTQEAEAEPKARGAKEAERAKLENQVPGDTVEEGDDDPTDGTSEISFGNVVLGVPGSRPPERDKPKTYLHSPNHQSMSRPRCPAGSKPNSIPPHSRPSPPPHPPRNIW